MKNGMEPKKPGYEQTAPTDQSVLQEVQRVLTEKRDGFNFNDTKRNPNLVMPSVVTDGQFDIDDARQLAALAARNNLVDAAGQIANNAIDIEADRTPDQADGYFEEIAANPLETVLQAHIPTDGTEDLAADDNVISNLAVLPPAVLQDVLQTSPAMISIAARTLQGTIGDESRRIIGQSGRELNQLLESATKVKGQLGPDDKGHAILDDLIHNLHGARKTLKTETAETPTVQSIEKKTETALKNADGSVDGVKATTTSVTTPAQSLMVKGITAVGALGIENPGEAVKAVPGLMSSALAYTGGAAMLSAGERELFDLMRKHEQDRDASPLAPTGSGSNDLVRDLQAAMAEKQLRDMMAREQQAQMAAQLEAQKLAQQQQAGAAGSASQQQLAPPNGWQA